MASELNTRKFDDVFLSILQDCGKIEPFLDAIFYFLARRTDFFHLMHNKNDKYGFPPGTAEKMVKKIFQKHQQTVLEKDVGSHAKSKETIAPPVAKEVEVSSQKDNENNSQDETKETQSKVEKDTNSSEKPLSLEDDCFNGSQNDKYSWSQTITDVDIKIPVPKFVKKSNCLSIKIASNSLAVELKQQPPEDSGLTETVLLRGDLTHRIKCEESMWSLLPSDHIAINLEKAEQKWWTAALVGDKEIDRTAIDTTQTVQDFDESTQADIRKVMYDQQQKMMGKPTSDEQKTHEMLRKAWDAEGSPFKGTPFDPSRVNMSGSGP